MNKIFLIGNLTGDPELRTTPSGYSVCTMNIAVNRRFSSNKEEKQTDFFRISAWRQLGENCSRYLSKGKKIAVIGELTARLYEAKDGATRMSLEVTADEIEFLSPRDQSSGGQQGYPGQTYQPNQATPLKDNNSARQNSWQDSRTAPSNHDLQGTALNSGLPEGFMEISDSDLPF